VLLKKSCPEFAKKSHRKAVFQMSLSSAPFISGVPFLGLKGKKGRKWREKKEA